MDFAIRRHRRGLRLVVLGPPWNTHRGELIRGAACLIYGNSPEGWRSLCSAELFIIASLDPPDDAPTGSGRESQRQAQAIVLSGDYPVAHFQEGWSVESIEQTQTVPDTSKTVRTRLLSHSIAVVCLAMAPAIALAQSWTTINTPRLRASVLVCCLLMGVSCVSPARLGTT